MSGRKRVDRYLKTAPAYARPVLNKVRAMIRKALPAVQEDLKWGAPAFSSGGLICSLMAFKEHVGLWFHKGSLLQDPKRLLQAGAGARTMKQIRLTPGSGIDLAGLRDLVRQAAELNAKGVRPKLAPRPVRVPPALASALSKSPRAKAFFDGLAPSHRRAYADAVAEAKRPETAERRLLWTIDQLERGRRPDEKYRK
jgi:hypothetical protein